MDSFCVCGHHYDEHDDGQECLAGAPNGGRCMCVYFEEAEEDDEPDYGPQPIGGPGSYS